MSAAGGVERPQRPDLVVVGRIGGPHGIDGAVRVVSATQPPENIEHYRPWLVGKGDDYRQIEVERLVPHGAGYLAWLGGVRDRDRAAALAGSLVAVPRGNLPELVAEGEYYWQDLIGMTVTGTDGRQLGTVRRLLETGAHDVLVIHDGQRETLVPFVSAFVVTVDREAGHILVDWQDPV